MKILAKLTWLFVIGVCPMGLLHAQDLAPRGYVVLPLHVNAITASSAGEQLAEE